MSIWFSKKTKTGEVALTRFEALDLIMEINKLLEEQKYGSAMAKIGMENMPYADETTLEELMQVFEVRMSDLMRYAGIKVGG